MTPDQEQLGLDSFASDSQGYCPSLGIGSGQTFSAAFSGSDGHNSTHGGTGYAPNNQYATEPQISTHQYARMLLDIPETLLSLEFVQQNSSFIGASVQSYKEPMVYGKHPHFLQGSGGALGSNVLNNEYGKLKAYQPNDSQHQGDGNHTEAQYWPQNPSPLPLGPPCEMRSDSSYGSGAMHQPSTTLGQNMDVTFNNGNISQELIHKQHDMNNTGQLTLVQNQYDFRPIPLFKL
ncbi:hypothetical protein BDD12DRAFT_876067 [Trichophaea hybrida]|nr:hypothetical protein BDD12DRAFT_876067 [Trichophaea hybrida]